MRLSRCLSVSGDRLLLLLAATLAIALVQAERDFNVNDSQVPVIEPKDVPAYKQDPYVTELMGCQNQQNEIVLSLLLKKHDWSELTATKRAHVQSKLAKFFAIPKEFISLDSVSKRELRSMHKLAMRKGGKGNKNIETLNRRLGRASFMIGCGPSYFVMGEPIAKQIAHQVKDGTIGALTEENFGLWFIWRKELKSRSQRRRRQSEGSGAEDDDYEYEDDGEEVSEPSTEVPAVTTHAHRHHHGVSEGDSASAPATPSVASVEEEIEESVSKLESVISKTIENTKNIKELVPVLGPSAVDEVGAGADDDDVEDVELQQLGAVAGKFQENYVVTTTTAATTATTAMPGSGTDVLKTSYMEEESANQVDAVAVVDVDAVATFSTADSTTPPPISGSVSGDTQHSSSSSSSKQKPFSPYDATSSVSMPSSSSSSVVPSIEAVETSSLPSMSTAASTTGTSSSSFSSPFPSSSPSSHIVAITDIVLDSNNNNTLTTSSSSSSTITPTATMSTTTPATTTTTLSEMSPKPNVNDFELSSFPPIEDNEDATTIQTTTTAAAARTSSSGEIDAHVVESTATHRTISSKEGEADAISTPNNNSISSGSGSGSGSGSLANNEQLFPGSSVPPSSVATTTPATPEATSTVSTFASTDYVEPQPENSVPIIKTRLQKLAVTSGKAFTMIVPEDTFWDAEDQSNLRLELTDKDSHELKSSSWLQFNADKRELYGLPLDDAVSRWQYRLSATDSGNATVTETVEISVQQHRGVRTINHEISIVVKINEKRGHNIDWQLKLINALARTLDDDSSSAVVVREIRQTPLDPNSAIFVYFNETLPTSDCPEKELSELVSRLDAQRLSDLVQPLLGIKSITGQLIGSCQKDLTKVKPTMQMAKNVPPMPRNQVDRVNASVGQLLVFKVPPDTFYDANDNDLTLTLKSKDHKELGTRHWLQFDSKNQEFYGIPKGGDTGSEEYLLVAEDSGGLSAHDALVVVVSHPPKKEFGAFFKAYLSIRHENFNADLQRKFVERIAKVNGDANTNQIQIRSINIHHDSDGTIVNFYNTSLYKHHNRCPEKELAATRSVYLVGDNLRDSVKRAMGPELNLTNFSVAPFGSCHHSENIDINQHEFVPTRTEEPSQKSTFSEEYLANFILPAVIILVMIVLASIVACCLHRRRHKSGKMELGDEEERKSFRAKGIPVIFQDEYEEKPEIGNKSPVILKDEKPPLLPPSYNTSNMNGDNDVDEYVPPPAVVVGGREVRGKSPATPSYRKPPPYVSP
ncbi:uncharacterized protein LOC117891532 isoform X3 [Drosophila subobscura]|uniref:uncharacterized protein LOC117891532 isoform X3 n=1 Tax=Drosophila subobscura TaxID=7241 RepID=UPI00155A12D3|nr:uncharacterized protein LOC117891532 isoform X3 [Drosophila subobscura]